MDPTNIYEAISPRYPSAIKTWLARKSLWNFVAGKVIKLNAGFSSKPWLEGQSRPCFGGSHNEFPTCAAICACLNAAVAAVWDSHPLGTPALTQGHHRKEVPPGSIMSPTKISLLVTRISETSISHIFGLWRPMYMYIYIHIYIYIYIINLCVCFDYIPLNQHFPEWIRRWTPLRQWFFWTIRAPGHADTPGTLLTAGLGTFTVTLGLRYKSELGKSSISGGGKQQTTSWLLVQLQKVDKKSGWVWVWTLCHSLI